MNKARIIETPTLYNQVAIAALQGILANPNLPRPIDGVVMALEIADSYIRQLTERQKNEVQNENQI